MLEKVQSVLDTLRTQREQVAGAGWFLQNCWMVQVKPGGTARTDSKYWQVRSRQPILDGKMLKHLKLEEVEDYRAAIERGRQLKQIDRQIEKLQQQLAKLTLTADSSNRSSENSSTRVEYLRQTPILPTGDRQQLLKETFLYPVNFTDLAEQERLVKEVLAKTQELRDSLRQSAARNQLLRAAILKQKQNYTRAN